MLCNFDLRVSVILDLVFQIELCLKNEKSGKGNKKQNRKLILFCSILCSS